MRITDFKIDKRFRSCRQAFLVTGIATLNDLNRKLLAAKKTGHWLVKENRVNLGDLMFVLLPHPTNKDGYPRELHGGIVKQIDFGDDGALFSLAKVHHLGSIPVAVKEFLGGRVPPQGNRVQGVWDETGTGVSSTSSSNLEDRDEESKFAEGSRVYRMHRGLERDPAISRKAKRERLRTMGKLDCDVCNINFEFVYGDRGREFIEAHHLTPVSKLDGKTKTKVSDFALVCSNCHRMLHRGNPLTNIQELRLALKDKKLVWQPTPATS